MSSTGPVTVESRDGRRDLSDLSLYAGHTGRTDRFLLLCRMYIPNVRAFQRREYTEIEAGRRRTCERNTYTLADRNVDKILRSGSRARESAVPLLLPFFVIRVIYSRNCNRGKCTDTLK